MAKIKVNLVKRPSRISLLFFKAILSFGGGGGNKRIKGIVTLAHMLFYDLARLKLKRIL